MKYFTIVMVMLFTLATTSMAGTISAGDLDLAGLTQAQMAELAASAAAMKTTGSTASTIDSLSEYAEFGKAFGSAISQTASELGVVTNEFIVTPAGKISVALIVWKVAGDSIAGFLIGIMWYVVLLPIWWSLFKRLVLNPRWITTETPQEKGKPIITKEAQTHVGIRDESNVWGAWLLSSLVVIMASGLIILA